MRNLLLSALLAPSLLQSQVHDLVGYWHNWNDGSAPYLQLDAVDPRYSVIDIAFAEPAAGTTYDMVFTPSGTPTNTFIAQVAALRAAGKKVLISIGGANATVQLNSDAQRDQFVSSLLSIVDTYGFDGIDIDLEGASISTTGGTIQTPTDAPIVRLIAAIEAIADAYQLAHGVPMMLTMAPETAFVQGGMSAFGGIWGAYLPIIDALRDRLSILHVQLYNSGSMYGIDGGIYTQGTADFIVSQTEALLQGFTTGGGAFTPLPASKVAIGLPACSSAAGGGYVPPSVLAAAVDYLLGTGPQPGNYTRTSTYPTLRGLMTWSINWDAVNTCGPSSEYAQAYEDIFGLNTSAPGSQKMQETAVRPTIASPGAIITMPHVAAGERIAVIDLSGRTRAELVIDAGGTISLPADLASGGYILRHFLPNGSARSSRILVHTP